MNILACLQKWLQQAEVTLATETSNNTTDWHTLLLASAVPVGIFPMKSGIQAVGRLRRFDEIV